MNREDHSSAGYTFIKYRWCDNWHTGMCPIVKAIEYDGFGAVKQVEFYTHPAALTVASIRAIKLCIRCGNPALFPAVLPYTSRYDSEIICGNCISELVDPAIDKATGVE